MKPASHNASAAARFSHGARRCASDRLLKPATALPLSERCFRDLCQNARRELPALARNLGPLAGEILALRDALLASLRRYSGFEDDLARLVPGDFLAATPAEWLPHLPRYLRAMQIRAERAALNPAKDAEKAKPLAPLAALQKNLPPEKRATYRWLLEEFRVSIFAQELGTAQPVSVKRLERYAEEN